MPSDEVDIIGGAEHAYQILITKKFVGDFCLQESFGWVMQKPISTTQVSKLPSCCSVLSKEKLLTKLRKVEEVDALNLRRMNNKFIRVILKLLITAFQMTDSRLASPLREMSCL